MLGIEPRGNRRAAKDNSFLLNSARKKPSWRVYLFAFCAFVGFYFIHNYHMGALRELVLSSPDLETYKYHDCKGRSLDQIKLLFEKEGIVMFSPCSLRRNAVLLDAVFSHVSQLCPEERKFRAASCERVVQSNHSAVLDLAIDEEILFVLRHVHGAKAFPFQTLNFKYGTAQPFHSDLIHFAGWPSLRLSAVWIAAEGVRYDSGPLEYFIGSHKEKFVSLEALGCNPGEVSNCYSESFRKYVKENMHRWKLSSMLPDKGDAIIWAANLIHGGGKIKNEKLTRMSQVTHYFFEGDKFYFEPKLSSSLDGRYSEFSLRRDVESHAKADQVINKHWRLTSPSYVGHYPSYHSDNLHTTEIVDTGRPKATIV